MNSYLVIVSYVQWPKREKYLCMNMLKKNNKVNQPFISFLFLTQGFTNRSDFALLLCNFQAFLLFFCQVSK